jgi:hypothetical protein
MTQKRAGQLLVGVGVIVVFISLMIYIAAAWAPVSVAENLAVTGTVLVIPGCVILIVGGMMWSDF